VSWEIAGPEATKPARVKKEKGEIEKAIGEKIDEEIAAWERALES